MEYNFTEVETKWQKYWDNNQTFRADNKSSKPKYFVLDMFPYPSGAGLHVGHPLGYIASDIYSRFKRLKGFNVLHPMGFDAYGLPAEQYAIQTGQHPAITTEKNLARYKEQLNKIGLSFDWEREVRTCDPFYYKWTQWTFIKLFNSYYNTKTDKAEAITELIAEFKTNGNKNINAACGDVKLFSADDWNNMSEKEQQILLMNYRLAYLADTMVNWCPALGTVLANDEVSEGHSVRGGHPVERKTMKQWLLRITAYSERLLQGLEKIDWSDSLKEIQRNWIGKSVGALVEFKVKITDLTLPIFTTRPDTIFGVTFMTLAPEHPILEKIVPETHKEAVNKYIQETKNRSERERIADTKPTGVFAGAYVEHPFSGKNIPIWIGDYVLMGYGTGAVMSVPAHDSRDYAFAKHFDIPIIEVISGGDITNESYDAKEGIAVNSDFINGLEVKAASKKVIEKIEAMGIGKARVNYRLRDAIFSRQRYWGEPFPVYYKDDIPYCIDEKDLPLELPEVDKYLPTEKGEPPLARAKNWQYNNYPLETNTMPGFAGSSAYYLRYMDNKNPDELVSKEANNYWQDVDLYIGGAEHATGHLIYSRFWNKFLYDLGIVCKDEPYKKLVNQGMIQGRSSFVYRLINSNIFVSKSVKDFILANETNWHKVGEKYERLYNLEYKGIQTIHADVNIIDNDILDVDKFITSFPDYANSEFVLESDGSYICGSEVEKMSKSLLNVVNPDDLIEKYGADTLRLYEMFLGPLEQSKPWDTKGIEGVFRFIRKLWRLYHDKENIFTVTDEAPTKEELKVLHKAIKKIEEDVSRLSFNTSVSTFMICVNELSDLKCNKKAILSDLTIIISPYAPHIAEELWQMLGNNESITYANFPAFNNAYLTEDEFTYSVSFNGKRRFEITLPADMNSADIEKTVLATPDAQKWLEGKAPKKVIVVPKKVVNVVV